MKKLLLLLLLLFVTLIGYSQQTLNESILHNNLQRDYIIHIPSSYSVNDPIPLVFCFHGYGSTANTIMSYTSFNYISDTAGFIVVYPQGTLLQGTTHWNVGGWTLGSNMDDVGFISSLLDSLSNQYNIDETRVYSTGMSNGGYMSFLLACQLSDRIAAIASVTGSMTPQTYNLCNPQHPMPILQIHATTDQTVPYFGDPLWTESINNVLQYWVDYNNCNTSPIIISIADINPSDNSTVERLTWKNGDNSVVTDHLKVIGGGHDWFGVWGNMDIHSSAEIWKFFSTYDINGLIGNSTFIAELTTNDNYLVKITDVLGREIEKLSNSPLFYIYNDGTVEKKIILEK